MTLPNDFGGALQVGWIGVDVATAATLIGTAMLLATVSFMVVLAIGPYYSSTWAERLAASTGEFETDSSDAPSGESA